MNIKVIVHAFRILKVNWIICSLTFGIKQLKNFQHPGSNVPLLKSKCQNLQFELWGFFGMRSLPLF